MNPTDPSGPPAPVPAPVSPAAVAAPVSPAAPDARMDAAEARRARRRAAVPTVRYPPELPITERVDELGALIQAHQVVIVAGETGSGKSTQLPKLCLALGRGVDAMIGHTQPRRIAARSVAERIAEELGVALGGAVGYAVRFSDHVGPDTLVKVMTDGILLAETRRDRQLRAYDTLIIDEAHERSLNIDFLLGYLKQLLPRRADLKVIITSATIDTAKFSAHFDDAPILEVSGRAYPVELRYRPFGDEPGDDRDQTQAITDAIDELADEGPGDVLVFLSGEREIHDTADSLRRRAIPHTEILPLYARLGATEQRKIFQPHRGRRIVLSTNVAETSLTVPGVRYVVDTGTARISRYNRRLKVQRLPIEKISQASADQRSGRCGRVAAGVAIRLFAEDEFEERPEFTEPEILRTNLASVILQAADLGLGDIAEFPFVDPPDARAIKDGVALLEELGAFHPDVTDPTKQLTPVGRRLARLPIDPRLGRMVLEAERNDCVREVMLIASGLSIQDPRERPAEAAPAADALHARFREEGSDFGGFLKLWDHLRELQRTSTKSEFRRRCKAEYLHYLRVREWQDVNRQLREVVSDLGIKVNHEPADAERIHRSLLAGLLSHIGVRTTSEREFNGARNARFILGAGSSLAKKPPRWVMAAELVETDRLRARVAAQIKPEWVERVGAHQCKRTYSDPRWDAERGAAVATERVTLYGIIIVGARLVDYARIDPVVARELFIQHALVERDWVTRHAFFHDNIGRIAEVRALEDRARRRDILIPDEVLFAFYDARIPGHVATARHFDQWWKQTRRTEPSLLALTTQQLIDPDAGAWSLNDFPDVWTYDKLELAVTYLYEPGAVEDGVTVHVPVAVLNQVSGQGFDWQVPGRRAELVDAIVRNLPKQLRRHLVPIGDHARDFLALMGPGDGPLIDELAKYFSKVAGPTAGAMGAAIHPSDFDLTRLPDHARITFAIEDDDGKPIAVGKDLAGLAAPLLARIRREVARSLPQMEQRGLRSWTIGTLAPVVEAGRADMVVQGYPALVDEGASVGVRVYADPGDQERAMRAGTRRLLALTITVPRKPLERLVGNDARLALTGVGLSTPDELIDDCLGATIDRLVTSHGGPAWDEPAFTQLRENVRGELFDGAADLVARAARIVAAAGRLRNQVGAMTAPAFGAAVADVGQQLRWLIHPGFVTASGDHRMADVERYVRAIAVRLDALAKNVDRDRRHMIVVQTLQDEADVRFLKTPLTQRSEVLAIRWLIEELRVSLFAQSIGTPKPVSETRIRRELDGLPTMS